MLIETVTSLMMHYFNDGSPVSARTLQRKCAKGVIDEALSSGFIRECRKDEDGYSFYIITEKGRDKRNK